MNMKRVAVEAGLSPIREYLSSQGYQVEEFSANTNAENLNAIIISGQDDNMMGMQDIQQSCPVINAEGMTPEEVARRLEQLPSR
jgi:hypothetical protein